MFRFAWFGLAFITTSIPLDSWNWLVALSHTGEEAQAMADDTASTIAYGFETDSTGYATTISRSETDDDVEDDPALTQLVLV